MELLNADQTAAGLEGDVDAWGTVLVSSGGSVKRWSQRSHWNQRREECVRMDFSSVTQPR